MFRKEASVKIDMANGNESDNEVMDVSEWKKSEIASNYRSIIRKAEKYISKTITLRKQLLTVNYGTEFSCF